MDVNDAYSDAGGRGPSTAGQAIESALPAEIAPAVAPVNKGDEFLGTGAPGYYDAPAIYQGLPEPNLPTDFSNPYAPIPELNIGGSKPFDLQDAMDALANKKPSFQAATAPTFFDWDKTQAERYVNSDYYQELGFLPDRDNETLYGERQTFGDVMQNAFAGGGMLAWNSFWDGWKGWGRMMNALFSRDLSKLMGSPEELAELDQQQKEIFNKYAIFSTPESEKSIFNKQFLGNLVQQGGFAVGALAQFASEELLTMGAASALKPLTGLRTFAQILRATGGAEEIVKDSVNIGATWKNIKVMNKLYEGLKTAGKTIAKSLPGTYDVFTIGSDLAKAKRLGATGKEMVGITFGALRRTMAEANMAFTESRMEAAGTYGDLRQQLYDKTLADKGEVSFEDEQRIEGLSQKAAWDNFKVNAAVISVMNRLQFDNIINSFGSSKRVMRHLLEEGDDILKVTGKAAKDMNVASQYGEIAVKEGQQFTKVYNKHFLRNIREVAEDFGKGKAAWEASKAVGRNMMKWEVTEGLQELIQESSNESIKRYYADLYSEGHADWGKSIKEGAATQWSNQGVKTFLMGAMTGKLMSPLGMGIHKVAELALTKKADRIASQNARTDAMNVLNAFFADPARFAPEHVANIQVQNRAAEKMEAALTERDKYMYENAKDAAFAKAIMSAKKLNMMGALEDTFRDYGKHFDDKQFYEAFGVDMTDENRANAQKFMNEIADRARTFSKRYDKLHEKFGDLIQPELFQKEDRGRAAIGKRALADAIEWMATNEYRADRAAVRIKQIVQQAAEIPGVGKSAPLVFRVLGDDETLEGEIALLHREIMEDIKARASSTAATPKETKAATTPKATAATPQTIATITPQKATIPQEATATSAQGTTATPQGTAATPQATTATPQATTATSAQTTAATPQTTAATPQGTAATSAQTTTATPQGTAATPQTTTTITPQKATVEPVQAPATTEAIEEEQISKEVSDRIKRKQKELEALLTFMEYKHLAGRNEDGTQVTAEDEEGRQKLLSAVANYIIAKNQEVGFHTELTGSDLEDLFISLRDMRSLKKAQRNFMDAYALMASPKKFMATYIRIQEGLSYLKDLKTAAEKANEAKAKAATTASTLGDDDDVTKSGTAIGSYHGYQVNDKVLIQVGNQKHKFTIERMSDTRVELLNNVTGNRTNVSLNGFDELIAHNEIERESRVEHLDKPLPNGTKLIDKKERIFLVELTKEKAYVLTDNVENVLEEGGKSKFATENEARDARDRLIESYKKQDEADRTPYTFDGKQIRHDDVLIGSDGTRYKVVTKAADMVGGGQQSAGGSQQGTVSGQQSAGVDQQRADIEEERQKELQALLPQVKQSSGPSGFVTVPSSAIPDFYGQILDAVQKRANVIGGLSAEEGNRLKALFDAGKIKTVEDVWLALNPKAKEINDRYDAKLAALNAQQGGQAVGGSQQSAGGSQQGPSIVITTLTGDKNITINNLQGYELAVEAAKKRRQQEVNREPFKLRDVNVPNAVSGYVKQGQTQEQADKELEDFLLKVDEKDLRDNLVIHISARDLKEVGKTTVVRAGEKDENKRLEEVTGPLEVQLLYNGSPIGTFNYYNQYQYRSVNGDLVEGKNWTVDQFKEIFDTGNRDAAELLRAFQTQVREGNNVYDLLLEQKSSGKTMVHEGKSVVVLKGKDITNLMKLRLFTGAYDRVEQPETALKDLRYNGVGGKTVVVVRRSDPNASGSNAYTESIQIEGNPTKQEEEALRKQIEKKKKELATATTNYVAVVELPNGELRFVPLLAPAYEAQDLDALAQRIAEQSKKTKDENINIKKLGGEEAKDNSFNNDFNKDLSGRLLFSVSVRNMDFAVQMSLNAFGNLTLHFLNRETGTITPIEVKGTNGGPLSFSDFSDLLSAINKTIEEYDKDPKVEARKKLKLRLREENFRKHLDTMDFAKVKEMPAFVSKNVVRDVSLTFRSKSTMYAPLAEPKVAMGVAAENVEQQNQTPPSGGAAAQPANTGGTPTQPTAGAAQQPGSTQQQPATQQPQVTTATSSTGGQGGQTTQTGQQGQTGQTGQQAQTGKGGHPVIGAAAVAGSAATTQQQTPPPVVPIQVSAAGAKVDEWNRLKADLTNLYEDVYNEYAATMNRNEASEATEKDKRVVELQNKIKALEDELDKEANTPKIISNEALSKLPKAAIVAINKFTEWVQAKLPDFIDVKAVELIKENMLKQGVTVGKLVYSLRTLAEAKKATITIDPEAPFKYHEAFHAVFRLLLRDDEIKKYLSIAKREVKEKLKREGKTLQKAVQEMVELAKEYDYYEGMSQQELEEHYLEEYMADRFDAWMMDPKVKTDPANKNFFRKILDWIRGLFGRTTPAELEGLFYEINAGKFRDNSLALNHYTTAERLQVGKPVEVPKIESGTIYTKDEEGRPIKIKQYLPEEQGTAIAAAIAATFYNRREQEGEDRHPDAILDEIIADYAALYDKKSERYMRYLDHPDTRGKYYKLVPELDKLHKAFTEGKESLKQAVAVHQRSMDYLLDEAQDEEDEVINELGDRGGMDFLKNKESFGGFGSLPKWLRQYIATTTYEAEDIYGNKELKDGEPLLQAVDATRVYSGILKTVAGFDDMHKMLLRMREFGKYNVQSRYFVDRFFQDMGIELTDKGYEVTKEEMAHKFMMVMKRFQQYTPDYLLFSRDMAQQNTNIIKANQQQAAQTQFSIWYNAYVERFENPYLQTKDKLAFLNNRLSGLEMFRSKATDSRISDEDLRRHSETISALVSQQLGLSLHPLYVQYSLACARTSLNLSPAQLQLVNTFGEVQSMKVADATQLINEISAGRNPFAFNKDIRAAEELAAKQQAMEDAGEEIDPEQFMDNAERLKGMARANAMFDETVNTTSFRNANGELIYAHQLPTYHLVKVRELAQILANGAPPSEALNELMNDPFMAKHFLLQQDNFRSMAGDLRVSRIEGISAKYEGARKGVTYGDFTEREMLVALFELYGAHKTYMGADDKKFMTTQHLIRVIEASNTGDTVNLPVSHAVFHHPFSDGLEVSYSVAEGLLNEVEREFERIRRVKEEIAKIEEERIAFDERGVPRVTKEVDGYHNTRGLKGTNPKPRGLTLFKTGAMLGTLAAEIEKEAQSDTPDLGKFKKRISKEMNDYLFGSFAEEKELLKNPNKYEPKSLLYKTLKLMLQNEIIRINKDGKLENVLLPKFIAEGFKTWDGKPDQEKNNAFNLGGDLVYNIAQVLANDFINTTAFNQLLLGDQALSLMDYVDMVKRAKGANGSGSSIYSDVLAPSLGIKHANTHSHIVQFDDAMFEGIYAGKSVAKADAQMWITVKSLRYTLFGLGKLTPKIAGLLDKLEQGEKVQINEVFGKGGSISYDGQTNSLKMVYYDRGRYIKTSGFVMTPELTSVKNEETGDWEARKGWEELHTLRKKLEDFEKEHETITMAVPTSASKNEKANTARNIDQITDWNFQKLDNRYWRLQTENPSNKLTITDPTQAKQLVLAEQDDKLDVEFAWGKNGEPIATGMKVRDLKKLYLEKNAQRVKLKFWQAKGELFDLQGTLDEIAKSIQQGKVTPKLEAFQKRALETLRDSGADSQLLEFFSLNEKGEPKYNLNHPVTLDKFTQLFLAHFSKGVMNEKIPGRSLTLVSSYGARLVKEVLEVDENGQPKRWRVIRRQEYERNPSLYKDAIEWDTDKSYSSEEERKRITSNERKFYGLKEKFKENRDLGRPTYILDDLRHNVPEYKLDENGNIAQKDGKDIILGYYTEYMTAPHSAEEMEVAEGYDEIPEVLAKAFGVRIPSQAPHSNVNLRLVDYLPAHYGSSAMFAPELTEISGADFDIDKEYTHNKEYYTRRKNGKLEFVEYGRAQDAEGQFEEFVHYQKRSNKEFKQRYRELLAKDATYGKWKEKARALHDIIKPFREASKKHLESEKHYRDMFRVMNTTNMLLDEIFGMDVGAEERNDLNQLMEQLDEKFTQNELKEIEHDLDINLKEWYDSLHYFTGLLHQADERITRQVLREFSMPETAEDYEQRVEQEGEQNIGTLNNTILDAKMKLLGNKHMTEWKNGKTPIAYEVASVQPLQDVVDYLKRTFPNLVSKLEEGNVDVDSILGKVIAYRNNKEGAANIGPAVNAILAFTLMNTFGVKIRTERKDWKGEKKEMWHFRLNGVPFTSYANTRALKDGVFEGDRILHHLSAIVSAMTDNAKERLAAKLGLNIEAVGIVSNMVAQGVPLQSAITFILQPIVQKYYANTRNLKSGLKTEEEEGKGIFAVGQQMLSELEQKLGEGKKEVELTDDILKENILTEGDNVQYEYSVLKSFLNLKDQTEYFNKVAGIMKLAKGLGTSHEASEAMDEKIADLKLYEDDDAFEQSYVPFDLRQVMTGKNENEPHHNLVAEHLKIFEEVKVLSKAVFIDRTDSFQRIADVIMGNLRVRKFEKETFKKRFKRDLIAYLGIRLYRKMLEDKSRMGRLMSLNNAMIYDAEAQKMPEGFLDIVDTVLEIRDRLPDNYFVRHFLNAIPTSIRNGTRGMQENFSNTTGINKAEINTWAKLNQLQTEKLQDSFLEIYQNAEGKNGKKGTTDLAWAMFHYLLVKDGGQFKNGSFIRYIPNFMFRDLLDATGKVNEAMIAGLDSDKFTSVFGVDGKTVMDEFARGYLMNVNNRNYIARIDLAEKAGAPKPFSFQEDGKILNVNVHLGVKQKKEGSQKVGDMMRKGREKWTDEEKARASANWKDLEARGFWKGKMAEQQKTGPAELVDALRFPFVIRTFGEVQGELKEVYYMLSEVDGTEVKSEKPFRLLGDDQVVHVGRSARYVLIGGLEGSTYQWAAASALGRADTRKVLRERASVLNNGGHSLDENPPAIEGGVRIGGVFIGGEVNPIEAFKDAYGVDVGYDPETGWYFDKDGKRMVDQKEIKIEFMNFSERITAEAVRRKMEATQEDVERLYSGTLDQDDYYSGDEETPEQDDIEQLYSGTLEGDEEDEVKRYEQETMMDDLFHRMWEGPINSDCGG